LVLLAELGHSRKVSFIAKILKWKNEGRIDRTFLVFRGFLQVITLMSAGFDYISFWSRRSLGTGALPNDGGTLLPELQRTNILHGKIAGLHFNSSMDASSLS
jgi:hypothetical protein